MKMIRRKGLAVCVAATLILSGFTVSAEESAQTENGDAVGSVAAVSGGDAAVGAEDLGEINAAENPAEDLAQTGNRDKEEKIVVVSVSSGDMEETDAAENLTEDQIMTLAADNIASGTDRNIIWVIDANGKLTVEGNGNLSGSHSSSNFAWAPYCEQIISAELNVTGMTDASWLFCDCKNMISIDMSGFDTSSVTNMEKMFAGCSSLTSLDVRGFDTRNVTNMEAMFAGCSSLTSLDVSGFDTGNVTNIGAMFYGCSSLTRLDVDHFDTSRVVSMSGGVVIERNEDSLRSVICGMFEGCRSLVNLDVSGFDTRNVTTMYRMFYGCNSLVNLDVSGFDTSNVTNMYGMFLGCKGLTSLDVSGFNTSKVVNMMSMFSDCWSLSSVDVSGFDTSNVTNMCQMFDFCFCLNSVDVSGFDTSNVTSMSSMFRSCSSLTSLDVSNFDTSDVTDMYAMFDGCSSLTSVDASGFDTSNVTKMFYMFRSCSHLSSLDVSNFDTSGVTDMSDMFRGCSSLIILQSPRNINMSVFPPIIAGTTWHLSDGTEVTELPQGLNYSVTLTRSGTPATPQIITTTSDLNMADVVRVKYVPYSYTVETNAGEEDTVTFSIEEGRLADGLQIYPATGEIYGVPLEAGTFPITVKATYSNPAYPPAYAELVLTVLDNTDENVGVSTDAGYEITQPVMGFNVDNISGDGTQTLVSQGEYVQFRDVYIDGRKLTEGQDYTSASGSTRITIMNQTLADGGTGTHTLGIEFRTEDGILKRAAQNYTISSANTENGGDNGNASGGGDNNSRPSVESPDNNSNNSSNGNDILPTADTPQPDFIIYTVEKGDSLWKIAVKLYGQGSNWKRIYEDNAAVIRNPGRIYAGQELVIRLAGTTGLLPEGVVQASDAATLVGTDYKVQKGDSLWTISRRAYGSGRLWNIIYEANRDIIADPERIRAGQVFAIPQR